MCGIAGVISHSKSSRDYRETLAGMVKALHHRGPDEKGARFFPYCALGHARLSIIDPDNGQQPMLNPKKNTGITFNGEIYGYQEIKSNLVNYPFRSNSDTEVILALYECYGAKLVDSLPGMFAFAIWDDQKQELFCARDRFGEKPFYYAQGSGGEFLFASEIKSILASGLVDPVLNKDAVAHYMQKLYVHPHSCIYENIHVLPAAHTLCYKNGSFQIQRYWQLPPSRNVIEINDAVEQFQTLFRQAVSRQLVADVPVAAFLSGGLDSISIVAEASKAQANLKTMSFGFNNDLSELPFARAAQTAYQTDHIELSDKNADISQLLLKMASVYDEPFADSSNIPTYLLSQLARQHAKVVLTGDGGDELLAGYANWYRPLYLMESQPTAPIWKFIFARLIVKFLTAAGAAQALNWKDTGDGLYYRRHYADIEQMHQAQNIYFSEDELSSLGLKVCQTNSLARGVTEKSNTLDDALRMDLQDYMPGDILVKTDRASMAHGLELRAPFLDVDFASFCISLPSCLKMTSREDKHILRKAYANQWPEAIRKRGKRGFGAPVDQWLLRDNVRALKEEYLNNRQKKIFDCISFEHSRQFFAQNNYKTWILLVLSLWCEQHSYA